MKRSRLFGLAVLVLAVPAGATAHTNWAQALMMRYERSAIRGLKEIASAQTVFREGDKDRNGVLDYAGSLDALARTGLVDETLGSGTRDGYVFTVFRSEAMVQSESLSQFLWGAEARPVESGVTGSRAFSTNHSGVIAYQVFDPDCGKPTHEHRGGPEWSTGGSRTCYGRGATAIDAERRRTCATVGVVSSQ